jgi:predicted RNase H-like HicB family nuclease
VVLFNDDLEGYRIMDLLTMNVISDDRYHKETDALVIYIGRSLNDIYIYNSGSRAFEIRSMKEFGGKALGSFDSFEKLFVHVISGRLASSRDEEEKTIKQYIAFIRTDGKSSDVVFPDFPGCVSAGKGFEDTVSMAHKTLSGHVAGMKKAGGQIPDPRSFEQIKVSWKDWPLWKDSDYITVLIALVPDDTALILMDSSLISRIDRATLNRSEFLVRAAEEYLDFLQDDSRDDEFDTLKDDGDIEHICVYKGDYCMMRLVAFLLKNTTGKIGDRIQYYMKCVSEFAESKSMDEKDAFDYLYTHKGIEYLHECYDVKHPLSPEKAVKDLTEVCGNNGGSIT